MCSEHSIIGEKDSPLSFFHPDRFSAQRIWFQYGFLKTWRLDESGTYLDGVRINGLSISDIHFSDLPYISIKIGVNEDADHVGGINLFGDKYGNYAQPLVLKLGYQLDK